MGQYLATLSIVLPWISEPGTFSSKSKIQFQNVYLWLTHKSALSPASRTVALESMIWNDQ
jgi:hypothetical protein